MKCKKCDLIITMKDVWFWRGVLIHDAWGVNFPRNCPLIYHVQNFQISRGNITWIYKLLLDDCDYETVMCYRAHGKFMKFNEFLLTWLTDRNFTNHPNGWYYPRYYHQKFPRKCSLTITQLIYIRFVFVAFYIL